MIKRNLLVIGMAALLGACGFHLRGTQTTELAIKDLQLDARDKYGETVQELARQLKASGVRLHDGAPYKLMLTREESSQRNASYTGSYRTVDYELTNTLSYQLLDQDGLVLVDDKVEAQQTYSHDSNNLVGSDQEGDQVQREMRRDLLQSLMVRLEQLNDSKLAELEETAQAKKRADDQAAAEAKQYEEQQANQPKQSPLEIPAKQ